MEVNETEMRPPPLAAMNADGKNFRAGVVYSLLLAGPALENVCRPVK